VLEFFLRKGFEKGVQEGSNCCVQGGGWRGCGFGEMRQVSERPGMVKIDVGEMETDTGG
jgi:hypothetical protein